jgi:Fis family transcriptional regulator, factor for inversion stimulation protein
MTRSTIHDSMRRSVDQYLADLDGEEPANLHSLFMDSAERPLLEAVMRHAGGNQSKAAQWLGINRNTLRRKLVDLDLPH